MRVISWRRRLKFLSLAFPALWLLSSQTAFAQGTSPARPNPPVCLWTDGQWKYCPIPIDPGCYQLVGNTWKATSCPVMNPLYVAAPSHPNHPHPPLCKTKPCKPTTSTPALPH